MSVCIAVYIYTHTHTHTHTRTHTHTLHTTRYTLHSLSACLPQSHTPCMRALRNIKKTKTSRKPGFHPLEGFLMATKKAQL